MNENEYINTKNHAKMESALVILGMLVDNGEYNTNDISTAYNLITEQVEALRSHKPLRNNVGMGEVMEIIDEYRIPLIEKRLGFEKMDQREMNRLELLGSLTDRILIEIQLEPKESKEVKEALALAEKVAENKPKKLRAGYHHRLDIISLRGDNWDNKGSKKPYEIAIYKAHTILDDFSKSVTNSFDTWISPFISSDEDGCITIEWHVNKRELHIDVSQEKEEYIKVWGTNIDNEMQLGGLNDIEIAILWDWLYSDGK